MIARVGKSLPGAVLQQPPGPPEMLPQMPEVIRQNFMRPKLEADFEGDGFSIQFYAEDLPTLHSIGAEVRGEGNPLRRWQRCACQMAGWSSTRETRPSSTSPPVRLLNGNGFVNRHDGAIATMKGGGTAGE